MLSLSILLAPLSSALKESEEAITWYYTAMGDSIAAGYENQGRSYVGVFANHIKADTGTNVDLIDKSRNGWRSIDLLMALDEQPFQTSIKNSKIITWNIVGNDLILARFAYQDGECGGADNQDCIRETVEQLKQNWEDIIGKILALKDARFALIRTMDFYNPFVNVDKANDSWENDGACEDLDHNGRCSDFEVFKPYFDEVNAHLARTAADNGVSLAQVALAFNGPHGDEDPADKGYIGPDGIHPNDVGHRIIADLLRALAYSPLWPEPVVNDLDDDGDGVIDEQDLCPEFPGTPLTDGC